MDTRRLWLISQGTEIIAIESSLTYFSVENHYSVVGLPIVSHKNAK